MDDSNPINELGFGIAAYFKMINTLLVIFFVLGSLSVPIMFIYNKYDGMNSTLFSHYLTQLSLGNVGFSTPMCRFFYYNIDAPVSLS